MPSKTRPNDRTLRNSSGTCPQQTIGISNTARALLRPAASHKCDDEILIVPQAMSRHSFELRLFLYTRLVGVLLCMATLLAGNAVATPVLFAFTTVGLETTTLSGAQQLARDHEVAGAKATATADMHGLGVAESGHPHSHAANGSAEGDDGAEHAARPSCCPQPCLGCPCSRCRDFVGAHFVAVLFSGDIQPMRFTAETPWVRFPIVRRRLLEPPPAPPPKSV